VRVIGGVRRAWQGLTAVKTKLYAAQKRGFSESQWQPQPPPQQDPPEDVGAEDAAEAPFPFPLDALNTESWMVFFFPAHLGQAIS